MKLSFLLRCEIDDALDELHQKLSEKCTIILSTTDGFEIARRGVNTGPVTELATIQSLFFSAYLHSDKKKDPSQYLNVTIDAEFGSILIIGIDNPDHPMILQVIAPGSQIIAQVLYQTRKTAETISKL